ncbi:MAG: hypothetical protein ACK5AZ_04665 [Bryobacteraceae bacterium]
MRRKLALLNLALVAVIALLGMRLRENWMEARAREQRFLGRSAAEIPPPPMEPLPKVAPVTAGAYIEVADKVLFSKDRSPVVVIQEAPPKPMPPLPRAYGLMDMGAGPTVILGEKADAPHRGYRVGEQIGEFTLLAVSKDSIAFEWDGKRVERRLEDLMDRTPVEPAPAPVAAPAAPASAAPSGGNASVLGAKPESQTNAAGAAGPERCDPNDSTPPGTVKDGKRKTVYTTPFANICVWEPVK